MASFVQKFGFSKKTGGGNSIQQEVILESMKEAQESLAAQISQDTSSGGNIEIILARDSKSLATDVNGADESLTEQEIEENSLDRLLKSIELAASPEELSALMQQYEELSARWGEKASQLRSEKHLKEYLSIVAALTMLQTMMQNPDLLLHGQKLSETLQTSLTSQAQAIESQLKTIQAQNQKLHEQTQQLTKQLSGAEQLLQAAIEGLKKDVRQLTPEGLQDNLKQLQETLKQVQELKEKAVSGKPLDFKEVLENLQKIQQHHQRLIESGKLGDAALQAILQLQQPLQQTLQQANLVQPLQENISRLQTTQIEQVRQNSSQIIQAQVSALATDKLPASILPPEAKGQVPPAQEKAPQASLSLGERARDFLPSQNHNVPSPQPSPTGRESNRASLQMVTTPTFPEPSQRKDAELVHATINQQKLSSHPSGTAKDNVIDITARLKERVGIENSTYKPLGKDALSQVHVCTESCGHGHSHAGQRYDDPKIRHQPMGKDALTDHKCHPDCGHNHSKPHEHVQQPKAMGQDKLSQAQEHVHKNGCCGTGKQEHHEHNHLQSSHKVDAKEEISKQKPHVHTGPNCCEGHGAKPTELGRSQHMAKMG